MWEFFRCLFTSCLQITVCFLMQYFEIYQPKTIIYSNFLGILSKIPFFWICFTILRFLWNKNVCSILCKYKLFIFIFSNCCCPRFAFVHILYKFRFVPQVMIVDEFTLNFKGTICIVCCNCKSNYLVFFSWL